MAPVHLVVDGSNIATEGRSLPSLPQLLGAVDAISSEREWAAVTVIVDATFGHRVDESERADYEAALESGRLITPPAGVIGRGDAFILEVADRANAVVLSNDSFQEFHGTFLWLFEEGRLLGGKHVPGVGWIFLPRSPVRGPTSRRAVSDAKRRKRGAQAEDAAAKTAPAPKAPADRSGGRGRKKAATKAKAVAVAEEPRAKRAGKEPEPYNSPLPFIEFVSAHPVGSVITAVVEQFSSHGAYVVCEDTRCYISLRTISEPPPRSARHVFTVGETRDFVVRAVDTPRRGIDLELPAGVVLTPREPDELEVPASDESPAVEAGGGRSRRGRRRSGSDSRSSERLDEATVVAADSAPAAPAAPAATASERRPAQSDPEPSATPESDVDADGSTRKLSVSQRRKLRAAEEATARQEAEDAAAREAADAAASDAAKAAGRRPAKKSVAKASSAKRSPAKRPAPADEPGAKKAPARQASAKKASAKKAPAKTSAPAKKVVVKKAVAKKASAKKAPAKSAAPAKKASAKKAASPAKKAVTKKAASPAKKAVAKKASAQKSAVAKKASAKKSAATKASSPRPGAATD